MPEKHPPEQLLQALWCLPVATEFQTTTGEQLRVEFPGWLNSGAGPDFLEARLCLGDQQLYGAVEFHTHTRLWQVHGHPDDPAYQQVILHVVLYHDPQLPPLVRDDGQTIPVVELATQLPEKWERLVPDGAALLKQYEHLPGHCGSLLPEIGQQRLRLLLQEATEQRLQQKMQPIQQAWDTAEPEELLHRALFAALGAPNWSAPFAELSQRLPWSALQSWLRQPPRSARAELLARWFGLCGLLPETPPNAADLHREHAHWRQIWERLENTDRLSAPRRESRRPQGRPERLLVGWFHHLQRVAPLGLLRFWLQQLKTLEPLATTDTLRQALLQLSDQAFHTPDWEPWRKHAGFAQTAILPDQQLLGEQRQVLLWVNGLLPFFLAYARQHQEPELESLLYRLLLVLPPEPENRHTRFLRQRLFALEAPAFPLSNCSMQQGMLQLAKDFCHNFHQGCHRCELVTLLQEGTSQPLP